MKDAETSSDIIAVIPARYGSTRFPGKALAPIAGKPMIQRTWEQASKVPELDEVIIATDDSRIREACEAFGAQVAMTREDHETGTDRIAEAIAGRKGELILNIQGDEPLVPPQVLSELLQAMSEEPDIEMGTVALPFKADDPKFTDPNVVKCVRADSGLALYFSRAPIPHGRDRQYVDPLHHWGIYCYRRHFLEKFVTLEPSPLERCESLEQLRALEAGAKIYIHLTTESTIGVDTPEDVPKVEAMLKEMM